jgi:hypothetical protein
MLGALFFTAALSFVVGFWSGWIFYDWYNPRD